MIKQTGLVVMVLLTSCSTVHKQSMTKDTVAAFDKQGHRGCRGLMPENTIPAMLKAIDLGITTLEMDAMITSDKKVILSHDPYFNHDITTREDGTFVTEKEERLLLIYTMPYDKVQTFDVGLKPHPRFPQQQKIKVTKPLLSDLIDSVEAYCQTHHRPPVFYNIETKSQPQTDNINHPPPAEFVELLMQVILSKGIQRRVIIQSFDFRTLQYLHPKYPAMLTAMLIEDYDKRTIDDQLKALGFVPSIYSPEYKLATKEAIDYCHKKGMKIIPWTVNDKPTIEHLKSLGVDGIITDYPNLF